jgi:hypothetical protein
MQYYKPLSIGYGNGVNDLQKHEDKKPKIIKNG